MMTCFEKEKEFLRLSFVQPHGASFRRDFIIMFPSYKQLIPYCVVQDPAGRLHGLYSDEQSPVGMVHLGMVCTITVKPELLQLGEELAGSLWLSPKDLSEKIAAESARLETWSNLALRLIGEG